MEKSKKKAGVRTLPSTRALIGKLKVSRIQGALSSLFHYTNISAFAKMVSGRSVWLSRIDQMNDGTEVFPNADRTYAFCLSAVPTENAGMWIAYGLPRKDAIRIRFSGKALHEICTNRKGRVEVVPVKGNKPLSKNVMGTASLQYVGYVSRSGSRVHVRDVIYKFPPDLDKSRSDVMSECGSFIKLLGWQYEHEIRLVVRLDEAIDAERIQLDVSHVIEGVLAYNSVRRDGFCGMPSVIVGPWGSCEDFLLRFEAEMEKSKCATRKNVCSFVEWSQVGDALIRDSEFTGKIRLGHCALCRQHATCKCDYCE